VASHAAQRSLRRIPRRCLASCIRSASKELKQYAAASPEIWSMQYPIAEQLLKVKSLSFKEKGDSFSGKLLGYSWTVFNA
jgi:hypothetical protein